MSWRWKVALPVLQLPLAVLCWLWGPIQYHKAAILSPGRREDVFDRLYPAPIERFRLVNNLPATVFANTVSQLIWSRGWATPARQFTWRGGNPPRQYDYQFGMEEAIFFAGVIALWYWVGDRIDEFIQRSRGGDKPRRKIWRIIEMVIVFAFGASFLVGLLIVAARHPRTMPPQRQMLAFSIVRPIALLTYFYFSLRREVQKRS